MKEQSTTRITIDFDDPPDGGTDWERLERMTEEEINAAAESDRDCQPSTPEQLAKFRRAPSVRRARENCGMTQAEFAEKFGLNIATVRDWEQKRFLSDHVARALLRIIEKYPQESQDAMLSARQRALRTAEQAEHEPDAAAAPS